MSFNAIILAGGKSKRMGENKATLKINGIPLIIHVMDALKSAGCEKFLIQIKSKKDFAILNPLILNYNVNWSFDTSEKSNVLEAIHIALIKAKNLGWEFAQLCPIDTPYVSTKLFENINKLLKNNYDVIIPYSNSSINTPSNGLEPLLSCLNINSAINEFKIVAGKKRFKLVEIFKRMNNKIITPEEWGKWGVTEHTFKNLNYPHDYQ